MLSVNNVRRYMVKMEIEKYRHSSTKNNTVFGFKSAINTV